MYLWTRFFWATLLLPGLSTTTELLPDATVIVIAPTPMSLWILKISCHVYVILSPALILPLKFGRIIVLASWLLTSLTLFALNELPPVLG